MDFTYEAFQARILFGSGKVAEIAAEAEKFGAASVLIISSSSQRSVADAAVRDLGGRFAPDQSGPAFDQLRAAAAADVARMQQAPLPAATHKRLNSS